MKRRAVGIFLVFFAFWPLGQHVLVRSLGVDPWKLAGWGMYCIPGPMKTVRVVLIDADGEARRLDFRRYPPEEKVLVDRFRERRSALGRLESPARLGEAMLGLHPEAEGVLVAILSLELDRETALLKQRIAHATYRRDGRDEPLGHDEGWLSGLFGP